MNLVRKKNTKIVVIDFIAYTFKNETSPLYCNNLAGQGFSPIVAVLPTVLFLFCAI